MTLPATSRLVPIGVAFIKGNYRKYWSCWCRCCGRKVFVRQDHMLNGRILSCGSVGRARSAGRLRERWRMQREVMIDFTRRNH